DHLNAPQAKLRSPSGHVGQFTFTRDRQDSDQEVQLSSIDFYTQVLDKMGRILEAGNKNFTDQIKARWESFCENALFFGVWNKSLKSPMGLDKSGQAIALMKALPSMFPSPTAPPKRLGSASEALFHVLEPSEDPNTFLQKRPFTSPVILVDSTNLLLATEVLKDSIHERDLTHSYKKAIAEWAEFTKK
ncbi:hypothetical protein JOQ06_002613, partial [Pogonophryne albipinna]